MQERDYAHGKGWPLLSAIVANRQNVTTGDMEPTTLKGFVESARVLESAVMDEKGFLRERQERVFERASNGVASDGQALEENSMPDFTVMEGGGGPRAWEREIARQHFEDFMVVLLRILAGDGSYQLCHQNTLIVDPSHRLKLELAA